MHTLVRTSVLDGLTHMRIRAIEHVPKATRNMFGPRLLRLTPEAHFRLQAAFNSKQDSYISGYRYGYAYAGRHWEKKIEHHETCSANVDMCSLVCFFVKGVSKGSLPRSKLESQPAREPASQATSQPASQPATGDGRRRPDPAGTD